MASETVRAPGYTDLVRFKGVFMAVGTDGRIDRILESGESETVACPAADTLHCAVANDEVLIAAGDHGTILVSTDGTSFKRAQSDTDQAILAVCVQDDLMIAGTDQGTILLSQDARSWNTVQIAVKGRIISLSANKSFIMGITDASEILKSADGIHWEIQDYNTAYAGYNQPARFNKILTAENHIIIIGTHDNGSPCILFSALGSVWAERLPVYYDDDGKIAYLDQSPNAITYDAQWDAFILACNKGTLLSLPTCKKCNEYVQISEKNLYAILYADPYLVVAGEDFSVFVQKL